MPSPNAAAGRASSKTLLLGLLALVLTGLTAWDNMDLLTGSKAPDRERARSRARAPSAELAAITPPTAPSPPTPATPPPPAPAPAIAPGASVPAVADTPAAKTPAIPAGIAAGVLPAAAPPAAESLPAAAPARVDLATEIARLRHIRDNADDIKKRYRSLAVAYAEHAAALATLYPAGATPRAEAERAIRSLVPSTVEISDLLLAAGTATAEGVVRVTGNIAMSSGDSQAMTSALLALGDAGRGVVWTELAVGLDRDGRRINARGQLSLLMLPEAE